MSTIKILLLCAIAFTTSFLLTPWARKLSFKIGALDMPNQRKMHGKPMATGGGIAIFLGFLAAFLFINRATPEIIGFIVATFIIVILGIFDDILDLAAFPKFVFQSLAAFIVMYFGVRLNMGLILRGRISDFAYLSIPLTYLWIVVSLTLLTSLTV
jgi:UDP-GlcNAc:undecaprenyl-phosphate GlcNAc-1-phosphate transferase